jgi:hypothetical protein
MKRLILALLFLPLGRMCAQPSITTITDRVYNSVGGDPFNGSVIVEGPNITGSVNVAVLGTSRNIQIVDGNFTVAVVPNQTSAPASTYLMRFSNGDVKTCNVPQSSTPITLTQANCIDGNQGTPPPASVALSQLASGGAHAGNALCFSGTNWGPGSCASSVPHAGAIIKTGLVQNIPSNDQTQVTLSVVTRDDGGYSSVPSQLTIPAGADGWYVIFAQGCWAGNGSTPTEIDISVNDSIYTAASPQTGHCGAGSTVQFLNAGDVVTLVAGQFESPTLVFAGSIGLAKAN